MSEKQRRGRLGSTAGPTDGRGLNRYKPDPRECALLFVYLVEEREERRRTKPMTRAQIAEISLRRLWNRQRLTEPFLSEVQEWLMHCGWVLFNAGTIYGAVRMDAVGNWPSLAAKRIGATLENVERGAFDFEELARLYPSTHWAEMKRPSGSGELESGDDNEE